VCKLDEGMGKVVCKADLFPDQGKNLVRRLRRRPSSAPAAVAPARCSARRRGEVAAGGRCFTSPR
jgi:hypothetical protein